ncbi:broad specificity phosphatase PhoE [Mycoplana sp. BE70]|nr:broad specificity phosphatase PhoE [Mycoplana sp. BE70]
MTTTFFLVRHAAHDNVGRFLAGRAGGVALSEPGRAQARRLRKFAEALPLDLTGRAGLPAFRYEGVAEYFRISHRRTSNGGC